tara:strand:- start:93 stop:506 length:414 start_codon:yes stop_codon:yes gene_type:complete
MIYDNLKPLEIGQTFEYDFKLDKFIYLKFLEISKDNNQIHTNNDFAISHGFDSKIMHGNILNIYLSFFIGTVLPIKNIIIISQNIFFKNPLYLNDIIKLYSEIISIHESVNIFELKFSFNKVSKICVGNGKIKLRTF